MVSTTSTTQVVSQPNSKTPLKRKRGTDHAGNGSPAKKTHSKPTRDQALDDEERINTDLAHMDANMIGDHIYRQLKRFEPDLSSIELEERRMATQDIKAVNSWEKPRTTSNYAAFVKGVFPAKELSNVSKMNGAPHTLVVASSGLRAADITRALREFQTKDGLVAKLFAKHIKMSEAIEAAKSTRYCMGVGTPARINDLLEDGALQSSDLKRIIVDFSHIDQKKRGILDMKDTLVPLLQLLNRSEFKARYGKDLVLVFY